MKAIAAMFPVHGLVLTAFGACQLVVLCLAAGISASCWR